MDHKLLPQLDQCIAIENAVDNTSLQQLAHELLNKNPRQQKILATMENGIDVIAIIGEINLNQSLALKLFVTREQQPELLIHSTLLTLFAIYPGQK